MGTRVIGWLLLALGIAAIASGCGDEDGSEGSLSTSSLSKAEYVEEVDEICARDRRKTPVALQAYIDENDPGLPERGDGSFTRAVRAVFVPALETKIEEIRALGAPSGDEDQVEAYLDAMEQAIDELGEKPVQSLNEFSDQLRPAAEAANEYGFNYCG